MTYKDKKSAIKYLIKKYYKKIDNVLLFEDLFITKQVVEWVFESTRNPKVIKSFMEDLEKYLNGEIHLKWVEAIIAKRESRVKNVHNQKAEATGSTKAKSRKPKGKEKASSTSGTEASSIRAGEG